MNRIILKNCNIYTMSSERPNAKVLCIENGVISYVGEQIPSKFSGKIIDLGGRTVLPGFIDSHMHLSSYALMQVTTDLSGTKSIEELKYRLKAAKNQDVPWIYGRGWDHEEFSDKRLPSRKDLDEVSVDMPILIVRKCGHVGIVNSLGIRKIIDLGLARNSSNQAELSQGVLYEETLYRVIKHVHSQLLSPSTLRSAIENIVKKGITSIHWMSADTFSIKKLVEAFKGNLPIRIFIYLSSEHLSKFRDIKASYENGKIKIIGIKLFMDGSFGARTAALRSGYDDEPHNMGILNMNAAELISSILRCIKLGAKIAIHIIGDRALEIMLDALERLDRSIIKHIRIEHLSLLPDDLFTKIKRYLPLKVSIQPRFVTSDFWIRDRLGKRAKYTYRFNSMKKIGFIMGIGSDAPVEEIDPWIHIISAINGPYVNPLEAIDIKTAIELYTIGSSNLINSIGLGTLRKGYYADLIVLDKDPFRCTLEELRDIKVLMTMVDGVILFDRINVKK